MWSWYQELEVVGAKKVLWEQLGWGGRLGFSGYFILTLTFASHHLFHICPCLVLNIARMQMLSQMDPTFSIVRNFTRVQKSRGSRSSNKSTLGRGLGLTVKKCEFMITPCLLIWSEKWKETSVRFPGRGWEDRSEATLYWQLLWTQLHSNPHFGKPLHQQRKQPIAGDTREL